MEKLKTLRITSLDDDENEEEAPIGLNGSGNRYAKDTLYEDDDDNDEDEDQVLVVLGVVEKPKNKWSLLRQLFPSKGGGTPVLAQLLYYFGVENGDNSLDWATIVAYTCDDSCEGGLAYKEEFA